MSFIDILKIEEIISNDGSDFGDRILLTLEYQRRSKSWLAEQIGISKQAINYLLKHSSNPKYVNEIAAALEVSPEWLLSGKKSHQILEEQTGIMRIPVLVTNDIPDFLKKGNNNFTSDFTHVTQNLTAPSCFATKLEKLQYGAPI